MDQNTADGWNVGLNKQKMYINKQWIREELTKINNFRYLGTMVEGNTSIEEIIIGRSVMDPALMYSVGT